MTERDTRIAALCSISLTLIAQHAQHTQRILVQPLEYGLIRSGPQIMFLVHATSTHGQR